MTDTSAYTKCLVILVSKIKIVGLLALALVREGKCTRHMKQVIGNVRGDKHYEDQKAS